MHAGNNRCKSGLEHNGVYCAVMEDMKILETWAECKHGALVAPIGAWNPVPCDGGRAPQAGTLIKLNWVRGTQRESARDVLAQVHLLRGVSGAQAIEAGYRQLRHERFAWDFHSNMIRVGL